MGTRIARVTTLTIALGALAGLAAAQPPWSAVDAVFGFAAKVLPGEVHRYGWPRRDLHVVVDGVTVEPALALGSWAGFLAVGTGQQVLAMGDLVLLDSEVEQVVSALQAGGLEVTAIHNHLLGESPHVTYVHFMGHGDAAKVAAGLRGALDKTATPPPGAPAAAAAVMPAAFKALQEALGRTGAMAGSVLQVSVARAEPVADQGTKLPPSMGLSTAMNFQAVGERVAATGDFVLVAGEVEPVVRELRAHELSVTALHSHMLTESPRLFFVHFWGLDTPQQVGAGLRAALSHVATAP